MSDSSTNQLLLLIAAAQQQQQQQALQQQFAKIQKAAVASSSASGPSGGASTSSGPSTSASTSSAPSTSSGAPVVKNGTMSASTAQQQLQNVAVAQQIAQIAQIGALLEAQKKQQQQQQKPSTSSEVPGPSKRPSTSSATPSTSSAATVPGMTPEFMMAWQQAMQMQALQQMMMTPQKNQMEEAIKKMMDMAKKKQTTASATTSSSTPSTSSSSSSGAISSGATSSSSSNNNANNMMNTVMWQLVAQQMAQKQQQQQKDNQKKAEQAKKAKEIAKQQQKEQDAKNRQQEEILKFLMAQHQLNHQKKHQKKQEESAALAAKVLAAHKAALESDNIEEGKRTSEAMLRLPLQLGWRRQTCVRSITAAGVKGDVSYFAPCGKKLGTYSETVRYLSKNGIHYITRDNFLFNTKSIIGEFVVPKQTEQDETRQEREFVMFTEDDINKELTRLNLLKLVPKVTSSIVSMSSGAQEEDVKVSRFEEPEEPLDPSELNDEFAEELVHSQMTSNGVEECKVRERESDDLLVNVNDVRHLPEFSRIANQCLNSQGFADALMIHEFVQNFGHVLGIDLEKAPKLESLCAGLAGDSENADSVLQLTRQLLRLALEFPGMGNEKRFGQGGGEMGLDRENFSEVMRLFLIDKGKRGEELSKPLQTSNFVSITGEQKAAILAFLCDELVCSRNVVTEIDRNLDEISRLKGEKWMREGKARALRSARSKKKNDEKAVVAVVAVVVKEEQQQLQQQQHHHESDSEPPTRPVTPKKNGVVAPVNNNNTSPNGAQSGAPGAQRKFTPGLGQCEVLTEQEESMSLQQMDNLIGELHQEAQNINQKIHNTNLKIRSFPFGTDRFHRNYWMLAHTDKVIVESLATTSQHNPGCNANEYASKDPPVLEQRVPGCEGIDVDVIACVEDLIDEVVLQRAKADKKTRKRYRRVDNHMKRGWWTMQNRDCIESLRSCMLSRGIRERALHRLLTKPWFLNELKFGTITLDPILETSNLEMVEKQGWNRLNSAIDKLQNHLRMSDVSKSTPSDAPKPIVVPTTMALAQIVKDDVSWKIVEEEDVKEFDEAVIRRRIIEASEMVDSKFWRPKFRHSESSTCELFEDWKQYVLTEAQTSSQLMVALQALEGMIMWERSSREALCQICKSMDGDEMLVCDGCESGCHMECFRPRMLKVPEGDWFCQRCREEKSGKPMCMFCGRETGNLHQCQRCAYHVHQECAQDGPKETINPETFLCPHCQEMKQMRFVKRIILRSVSEERELEDDHNHTENGDNTKTNGVVNGSNGTTNGVHPPQNGVVKSNLKRKLEPPTIGGLPKNMNKELCQLMLDELVNQGNALPFLEPVNPKLVPGYKMVIMKPMDLKTIRHKNDKLMYETPEDFAEDVELMFANCRQFNIDHSDIGRAGISLNKFFQKRWKQLKYNFTKRLRRLHRQS